MKFWKPLTFPFLIGMILFFWPLEVSPSSSGNITVEAPRPFASTTADSVEIAGSVLGAAGFWLNGREVPLDRNGRFKIMAPLPLNGRNNFFLTTGQGGKQNSSFLPVVKIKTYPDIKTSPYQSAIETVATLKIPGSLSFEDNFQPAATLSRAAFSSWLVRALGGSQPAAPAQPSFIDVPASHPAFPYIESAASQKWLKGDPSGRLFPDQDISRGETLVWLLRALKFIPFEGASSDNLSRYHLIAVKNGLIPEAWQKNHYFLNFKKNITRAEAAWLLARTRPIKLRYRQLFENRRPLIKEIWVNDLSENSGSPTGSDQKSDKKALGFKILIQLADPEIPRPDLDVSLNFLKISRPPVRLATDGQVSPADDLIYAGQVDIPGNNSDIYPWQLNVIDENGIQITKIFHGLTEIQKFNQEHRVSGPAISQIRPAPAVFSRQGKKPVLVEIVLNSRDKKDPGKIYLDLAAIGKDTLVPAGDDGRLGDKKSADGIFSLLVRPAPGILTGDYQIPVIVEDSAGFKKFEYTTLKIVE